MTVAPANHIVDLTAALETLDTSKAYLGKRHGLGSSSEKQADSDAIGLITDLQEQIEAEVESKLEQGE